MERNAKGYKMAVNNIQSLFQMSSIYDMVDQIFSRRIKDPVLEKLIAEIVEDIPVQKPRGLSFDSLIEHEEYYVVTGSTVTPSIEVAYFIGFDTNGEYPIALFYTATRKFIAVDSVSYDLFGDLLKTKNAIYSCKNVANKYFQSLCGKKATTIDECECRGSIVVDVYARFID